MSDLQAGYTFTDGVANDFNAANINNALAGATILPAFVTGKPVVTPVATDKFILYQTSGVRLAQCPVSAILALAGTVRSVRLTAPSDLLDVTGSPVVGTGTLALSKVSAAAKQVYATPTNTAGLPQFRNLTPQDTFISGGQNLASAPTVSADWSMHGFFSLVAAHNILLQFINKTVSQSVILVIDNSAGFTITWGDSIVWPGAAPVPSTGLSRWRFTNGLVNVIGEVLKN